MINGAVTIGTEDGANVEIHEAVGDDNIFIFGMRVSEVEELYASNSYNPWNYSSTDSALNQVLNLMNGGINGVTFGEIVNALTTGGSGIADQYFVLADFADYKRAQSEAASAYNDKVRWGRMSLTNIAKAGIFSADRAVLEYADRIWNIKPLKG